MKSIFLSLLLAASAFSASFPVFFGNSSSYISNNVPAGTWHIVVNGEMLGFFTTNGIVLTNAHGITIEKTNNSSASIFTIRAGGVTVYDFVVSSNVFTIRDVINNDPVLQYDLSKRLMTLANAATSIKTDTFATTNKGSSVFQQDITATGFGKLPNTVSGLGGANTNFTLLATQSLVYINGGLTNVSVILMGGESGRVWEGSFTATNWTANDRTLAFNAISNQWRSVTHFDGVATNGETLTITNNTAIVVWWRLNGSNVLYAAKHVTLPGN
jgi:hypothetical protein